MKIINIKNANKKYKNNFKLDNINLLIQKNEIIGLVGPNGAGKTSLIKLICNLLKPDSYDKFEVNAKNIGLILSSNQLYNDLTVIENIIFFLKMNKTKFNREKTNELLVKMGLEKRKNELVRKLSTGMKQKLNIIRVLLLDVDLLILDEPTSGVDPLSKREIHNNLRAIYKELKKPIIISSHSMNEIEKLCDRIILINNGKIINDSLVSLLMSSKSKIVYDMLLKSVKKSELIESLKEFYLNEYLIEETIEGISLQIFDDSHKVEHFLKKLDIKYYSIRKTELEDIFLYEVKNSEERN